MKSTSRAARNALLLTFLMLAAWQLLFLAVGDTALRSPAQTLRYAGSLLVGDMIWPHMRETMTAFALALLLAIAAGLTIGFILGYNSFASDVFEPMLVAIYSIPKSRFTRFYCSCSG